MAYALLCAAVAFALAVAAGPFVIRTLEQWRFGKEIRPEGPERHLGKSGTPTMGGIIFIGSTLVTTVLMNAGGRSIAVPLGALLAHGAAGALDDLQSLVGSRRTGLSAPAKLAVMLALALVLALILRYGLLLDSVYLPFLGKRPIGLWYVPIATLTILGTANAVNLSDGLDTLAGGTAGLAFAAYGIIAYLQEQGFLATFSFTLVGALLGFLWFNAHPARVFMGDTGSLALGAALAVVALMTGHWLLLPLVGIVFVAEALSVMVQVAYFKLSGGRRLLRMSPLHHHFELLGWSEPQITLRFWLAGMVAAMLGVALALT